MASGFLDILVSRVIPAAARCLQFPEGEVKVLILSCLRRLLPASCKMLSGIDLKDCRRRGIMIAAVLQDANKILQNVSPLPQYMLRMVVDTIAADPSVEGAIVAELRAYGALLLLIQMLSGSEVRRSSDTELTLAGDPQIALLLHIAFRTKSTFSTESLVSAYLLNNGLPIGVAAALGRGLLNETSTIDLAGLTGIIHLVMDCLEGSIPLSTSHPSKPLIAPLESASSHIYSILRLCSRARTNSLSNAISSSGEDNGRCQLQCLACVCLALHLRVFVEAGFRSFLLPAIPDPRMQTSSKVKSSAAPIDIFIEILQDLTVRAIFSCMYSIPFLSGLQDANDQTCGAVISFLSQIVKVINYFFGLIEFWNELCNI